jgi:hypothetical protein
MIAALMKHSHALKALALSKKGDEPLKLCSGLMEKVFIEKPLDTSLCAPNTAAV